MNDEPEGLRPELREANPSDDLSARDRAFLDEFAHVTNHANTSELLRANNESLAAELREHRAASMDARAVAELLDLTLEDLLTRTSGREIVAISPDAQTPEFLYPTWQFIPDTDNPEGKQKLLPHLEAVLAALPSEMHSLELHDFFTIERSWLRIGDEPACASRWLAHGMDPEPVLEMARTHGIAG